MTREEQLRQNTYREIHRDRMKRRREPTGRDVATALSEIYIAGAIKTTAASHRTLVARLVSNGFDERASADFVQRMVDRARRAAEDRALEDDEPARYQC